MKIKLSVVFIAAFFTLCSTYGQFSFGVSPGIGLNSTYFGYKVNNKIVPFIGFQLLHGNFKYLESGEDFDYDLNQVIQYSDETKFKGNVYIPNIGVKYFIIQKESLQAYLSACISKPLLSGKLTYDGEEEEEFNDEIKNVRLWGGEIGFGAEYFLDEHFSLGGEFGLRFLHAKYKTSYETDFYNPIIGDYQETTVDYDYKFNLNPTYSKIALNYYF